MPAYAALLRGINVGGKNKVPMPALRAMFEELGFSDVVTYVQSGNVVFRAPRAMPADRSGSRNLRHDVSVVLRTGALGRGRANPFLGAPNEAAVCLPRPPGAGRWSSIDRLPATASAGGESTSTSDQRGPYEADLDCLERKVRGTARLEHGAEAGRADEPDDGADSRLRASSGASGRELHLPEPELLVSPRHIVLRISSAPARATAAGG